ncbi:TIGR02391 family protein [Nocardia vulneris]|uniref:TIGR02391 family protein n=1 Tax=Nocardia vulneris TaxID=1141657 RepID=UPI0014354B88|nr:TIGR02391 family protein [Nocardia vulneris]
MNLNGVNVEWVRTRLREFVDRASPVIQRPASTMRGRDTFLPACGRDTAIELAEPIRQILDKLYPEWQSALLPSSKFEFTQEREGAQRLLARLESYDEVMENLGGSDLSPQINASGLHPLVWQAASAQWATGHRHEAVLAAAKAVNSMLQAKLSRRDVSELDLVKQAFTEKAPEVGKPRLRYDEFSSDQTAESMRRGVMEFGSGCFSAIRNPLGHLPNDEIELTEHTALERLCAFSLFARFIEDAQLLVAEGPDT